MGKKVQFGWRPGDITPKEVRDRLRELIQEQTTITGMATRLGYKPQRLRHKLLGITGLELDEILKICSELRRHPCDAVPGSERYTADRLSLSNLLDGMVRATVAEYMRGGAIRIDRREDLPKRKRRATRPRGRDCDDAGQNEVIIVP